MVMALRDGHAETWGAIWNRLTFQENSSFTKEQLGVALLDQANHHRQAQALPWLKLDLELETLVQNELDGGLSVEHLEELVQRIQKALPRYLRVSVCVAGGATANMVLNHFQGHLQKVDPQMTHYACALRSSIGGLSNQALLVTGQRLRDFAPELLDRTTDSAFFNVCPHCQSQHVSKAMREQDTTTMECPTCNRVYAVVATDTDGKHRYVNEFLSGYEPAAVFTPGQSRVDQLFTIWSAVQNQIRYVRDPGEGKQATDRWQTALETLTIGQGDCEDSAILLADWLLARGFQVRVALGKYGDIGGHAWCVVKVDEKEYLLETTSEGNPSLDYPPLVSRVGSRYVPEVLFDRWAIYVRNAPRQLWNGDYWTERNWIRIEPRVRPAIDHTLADQSSRLRIGQQHAYSLQRDLTDPSKLAFSQRSDPSAAPFLRLEDIETNDPSWRVKTPEAEWPGKSEE